MGKQLEKYLQYRNDFVIAEYQKKFNLSYKIAESHFVELLKFLYVCAHKDLDIPYSPSTIVDEVWHIFLWRENEYEAFCQKYLGTQINHVEGNSQIAYYLGAKNNITNLFGQVDSGVWLEVSDEKFVMVDCSNWN